MKKYDVAVIGGGFAGVAAAISAAREGAKVLIVEKGNALGGAAINCLVNPFMPYATKIDGKKVNLSAGIFEEIHKKLEERNAIAHEDSFLEEDLKHILVNMARDAGVDLLYHAYIFKAEKNVSVVILLNNETICSRLILEGTATDIGSSLMRTFGGIISIIECRL